MFFSSDLWLLEYASMGRQPLVPIQGDPLAQGPVQAPSNARSTCRTNRNYRQDIEWEELAGWSVCRGKVGVASEQGGVA